MIRHLPTNLFRGFAVAVALGAAVGAALFVELPASASVTHGETRAYTQQHLALPLAPAEHPSRLASSLADVGPACDAGAAPAQGAAAYAYVSAVTAAPGWFNALGFAWDGAVPSGARMLVRVRTSQDGAVFGPWVRAEELDALQGSEGRTTDLVFSSGRFYQYQVAVEDAPDGWSGQLDRLTASFIDSTDGPTAAQAAQQPAGTLATRLMSIISKPNVVGRKGWGANENLRYSKGDLVWPPSYEPVKKIVVHHTATTLDPQDPAAVVRAIYQYHTVSQGWGDIGYNYLIDSQGRVYEGRSGGRNVIGAHALKYNKGSIGIALIGTFQESDPSSQAVAALDAFVVSKSAEFGIDPRGKGFFIDKDLPNVMGHRDGVSTSCPGARVQGMLPALRTRAFDATPEYGAAWKDAKVPKVLDPGIVTTIDVVVANSGSREWALGAKDPVRVGYRWLKPDGTEYLAEPNLEVHTDLPKAVAYGQSVTVKTTVRTPEAIGRYVLRFDMLQERVTWFEPQGNVTLDVPVTVSPLNTLSNERLIELPNTQLVLVVPERLRTLPLSRLTLLENAELLTLVPEVIKDLTNERVLSFSNDILLRYLPDERLRTFSMERIRTFPREVQERLGLADSGADGAGGGVAP